MLAEYAREHSASVTVIPTCVDTRREVPHTVHNGPVTVGWTGSWNTAPELELLRSVLPELAGRIDLHVLLIGGRNAGDYLRSDSCVETRPWSLAAEEEFLDAIDIGLMPLYETPWNRGKCAYKLNQFMSAGVPYVASPVGMNVSVTAESGGGILADTQQQWLDALERLATDEELRMAMGRAGRSFAQKNLDYKVHVPTILSIIGEQ